MDVVLAARITVAAVAVVLAWALIVLATAPAPAHRSRFHHLSARLPRRRRLPRLDSGNLMSYVAAAMAVALAGAIALTG